MNKFKYLLLPFISILFLSNCGDSNNSTKKETILSQESTILKIVNNDEILEFPSLPGIDFKPSDTLEVK